MPEFTSPWLETDKNLNERTDKTDKSASVSSVSAIERGNDPFQTDSVLGDEIAAVLAATPPPEEWNLAETVAHILAMTEGERAVYYSALIHDWRAWRLAIERFGEDGR